MRKRNNNGKKNSSFVVTIIVAVIVLSASTYVFGKYYENESRKAVVLASDFYFSSDTLYTFEPADFVADGSGIMELNGGATIPVIYNNVAWDGNDDYSFVINVRNYQNPLLYNDSSINIEYTAYFQLSGTATGYTVMAAGENPVAIPSDGSVLAIDGVIEGGSARNDSFTVNVSGANRGEDITESEGVKVWVIAKSPDYVRSSKLLVGELKASTSIGNYLVTGMFGIMQDGTVNDSNIKSRLDMLAALEYVITSTGSSTDNRYVYNISWNANVVELNPGDKMLKGENPVLTNYVENNGGWGSATLTIEPYSMINITFYKAEGFDTTDLTVEEFVNYVTLEKAN